MSKATDKKSVDDKQLARLAQPLIKEGLAASAVIKKLRANGYSFSGKRVRVMYAGKPATKPAAPAKGKAAATKGKVKSASKPSTAKGQGAKAKSATISEAEAGLGIQH